METDGNKEKAGKTKKRFWLDWEPMEKFNFTIAVFTVVYSLVSIGLYRIAKNSLVVSQRAFVFAKSANVFNSAHVQTTVVRPPNAPAQVVVTFRNSGQTVAKNSTSHIEFVFGSGIPSGFDFPYQNEPSKPVLIAPQSETSITKAISLEQLAEVESGKTLMFVYGENSYQDVFGDWHRTEYCFQYYGYSLKPTGEIEEYLFYTGPMHNCSDADCKG